MIAQMTSVAYVKDYVIRCEFSHGKVKFYDCCAQLIGKGVFNRIKAFEVFRAVNLQNHTVTWLNGEVDIAPDTVYTNGSDSLEGLQRGRFSRV